METDTRLATILPPISQGPTPTPEVLAKFKDERFGDAADQMALIAWESKVRAIAPNLLPERIAPDPEEYERYRATSEWAEIKRRVLAAAGRRCRCCGARTATVHHRDYRPEVLLGVNIGPLVAICSTCHDRVHFDETGKRRQWEECEEVLREWFWRISRAYPADLPGGILEALAPHPDGEGSRALHDSEARAQMRLRFVWRPVDLSA